jgi:hypothetical protein
MRPIRSQRTLLPSKLFLIIVEKPPRARKEVSSIMVICVPKLFHLPGRTQADSFNCGVYTCLAWTMFVAVEQDKPALWMEIDTLEDLDQIIVKPFWDLHENKEDPMVHFHYKLCRLMEFLLD